MIKKLKIMLFPGSYLRRFKSGFAKRIFFMKQYEATVKKIWGLEFARDGLKDAREILRREYDKLTEDIDAAKIAKDKAQEQATKDILDKSIETKTAEIEEWKKKVDLADETIQQVVDQIGGYYEQLPRLERAIRE